MKLKLIANVVCIALVIFFINIININESVLLLEKKRENCYKYLAPEKGTIYYLPENVEKTNNLLRNIVKSKEINGMTFRLNPDSSITINGVNNGGNISLCIATGNYLQDGKYLLTDGNVSNSSIFMYSEGWKIEKDGTIKKDTQAVLPKTNFIEINSNKYNQYWIGIHVDPGCKVTNLTFYPMLLKGENKEKFEPAWMNNFCGSCGKAKIVFNIPYTKFCDLNESDLKLFGNFVKWQLKKDFSEIEVVMLGEDSNYLDSQYY